VDEEDRINFCPCCGTSMETNGHRAMSVKPVTVQTVYRRVRIDGCAKHDGHPVYSYIPESSQEVCADVRPA